jgi:hypothetical protein
MKKLPLPPPSKPSKHIRIGEASVPTTWGMGFEGFEGDPSEHFLRKTCASFTGREARNREAKLCGGMPAPSDGPAGGGALKPVVS